MNHCATEEKMRWLPSLASFLSPNSVGQQDGNAFAKIETEQKISHIKQYKNKHWIKKVV